MDKLATTLRDRPPFEIMERAPNWAQGYLEKEEKLMNTLNTLGKIHEHLYGDSISGCAGSSAAKRSNKVEVDRTRGQAGREDHRRILGADHRGRRQLPHVRVPGARRRASDRRADRHLGGVPAVPGQGERAKKKGRRSAPQRSSEVVRSCRSILRTRVALRARSCWASAVRRSACGTHFYHRVDRESGRHHAPAGAAAGAGAARRSPSTTGSRAAARATSKSARTSTTRCTTSATWCWR